MPNIYNISSPAGTFKYYLRGDKSFEIRKDDPLSKFMVGDVLILSEGSPTSGWTGRKIAFKVVYTARGTGVVKGYVCMGLQKIAMPVESPKSDFHREHFDVSYGERRAPSSTSV